MSRGPKFSAILVMALLLCSMVALTQAPKSQASSSTVNIDDALKSAGLAPDVQISKYNNVSTVTLNDPILVVKGSGMDQLEQQVFGALSQKYSMNASYLIDDKTHTFDNQNIENYDIIAVGGPLHNAFSSELLGRGILKVKYVYFKNTGLVVEVEKLSTGHTILVLGSFASYTYKEPPNTSTVPQEPGGGGGTSPTPEPGTASVTPTPENLHVTAEATVTPGHHDTAQATVTPEHHEDNDYMAKLEDQLLENGLSKNDVYMKFLMNKFDVAGYFASNKVSDADKEEMVKDIVWMTADTNYRREFIKEYNMMSSLLGGESITIEYLKKMGMSDEDIEMMDITDTPPAQNTDSDSGGMIDDLYFDAQAQELGLV